MTVTELIAVSVAGAGDLTATGDVDVQPDASQIGPGSLGFWIVIGLIGVLVFLYRSMRKQIRRVDFDTQATTDEDRVASHHEPQEEPHERIEPSPQQHDGTHDDEKREDEKQRDEKHDRRP